MKKLLLIAAAFALVVPSGARAGTTTITVLDHGTMFNTLEFAATLGNNNQDPALCGAANANHHTHAGAPGEGHDTSGWCDAIQFRTFQIAVPSTNEGLSVVDATLNIAVHFANGNEPPTDQLPPTEQDRRYCDVEFTLLEGAAPLAESLGSAGNTLFASPHTFSGRVAPGKTYTLVVDPFIGPHIEWHVDATLTLTVEENGR